MIRKLAPIVAILVTLIACSKDKFQTEPSLEVKSHSEVVAVQSSFNVSLEFTDKEGDLSGAGDSTLWYKAELLNTRRLSQGVPREYFDGYAPLPEFPDKSSGEIQFRLEYRDFYKEIDERREGFDKNDTIRIRFAVKDRDGNLSDTAITGNIVLLGQ